MNQSTITIDVSLDENRIPDGITWRASDTTVPEPQKSKAMMLSFWDGTERTALRIDLWTKEMMVDEMADFMYQAIMSMADTFQRATNQKELADDLKKSAQEFYQKFTDQQEQQHKH